LKPGIVIPVFAQPMDSEFQIPKLDSYEFAAKINEMFKKYVSTYILLQSKHNCWKASLWFAIAQLASFRFLQNDRSGNKILNYSRMQIQSYTRIRLKV
jgi:hypothetical protein